MIQQNPKPKKMGTYNRTEAQKKREDFTERGDLTRGYAKSKMDSGQITYPNTGQKI